MREILSPGDYSLNIGGDDSMANLNPPSCSAAIVKITVAPVKYSQAKLTDQCLQPTPIGNKLKFGEITYGNLTYNLATKIFDTAYINIDE